MPVALLVVVVATTVLLAAFAPRTLQRVRGKVAARIQLRDGLAWRGDTPLPSLTKPATISTLSIEQNFLL